jgi:hypothetical protein
MNTIKASTNHLTLLNDVGLSMAFNLPQSWKTSHSFACSHSNSHSFACSLHSLSISTLLLGRVVLQGPPHGGGSVIQMPPLTRLHTLPSLQSLLSLHYGKEIHSFILENTSSINTNYLEYPGQTIGLQHMDLEAAASRCYKHCLREYCIQSLPCNPYRILVK